MDRVFLDANVLFSAAYTPGSPLIELWSLPDTQIVTSMHSLEEARRNLIVHRPAGVALMEELISRAMIVGSAGTKLPEGVVLADKDVPILMARLNPIVLTC